MNALSNILTGIYHVRMFSSIIIRFNYKSDGKRVRDAKAVPLTAFGSHGKIFKMDFLKLFHVLQSLAKFFYIAILFSFIFS